MKKLFIVFLPLCLLYSCSTKKQLHEDKTTFYSENDSINLYVFIGKGISVIEFDPNENNKTITIDKETGDTLIQVRYVMDYGFNCKYEIIENVFNKLETDTIDFVAYSHYGRPGFEYYEYILLYLSKNEDGTFFHQKYMFDPLKKRKNKFKGIKRESIEELFNNKKNTFLKARGVFLINNSIESI